MTTLSYTVDVSDIEQFIDHELRTTYRARVWAQSAFSSAVAGTLAYALIYSQSPAKLFPISIAVVVSLITLFAMPSVMHDQSRKAIRKRYSKASDIALGPQSMSLGPEGLDFASPNGRSHLIWAAVQRIALTQNHAFIFTGPLKAIILPLHQIDASIRTEVLAALAEHVSKLPPDRAPAA